MQGRKLNMELEIHARFLLGAPAEFLQHLVEGDLAVVEDSKMVEPELDMDPSGVTCPVLVCILRIMPLKMHCKPF
jgi:hypothetical protein